MSVIKPIDFMNENKKTLRASLAGFFVGAFFMGCFSYYMFLRYEVAPRVPALVTAWTHHEEVQSLQISNELVVQK